MEIRNNVQMNNTSFGMAFKRPSVDKMQDFVEYVGKGVSGKRAKKALTALQKQQASNHHFDIEYIGDGTFKVVPKSSRARKVTSGLDLGPETRWESELDKSGAKVMERLVEARRANGGKLPLSQKIRRIFVDVPSIFVAGIKDLRNPLSSLPENLQAAAETANIFERRVEAQIAKEKAIASAFPTEL